MALVAALVVVPSMAWAYLSSTLSQTNSITAGTLYAPGTLSTQHVEAVNNDGSVTLTWNETSGSGTLTPPQYQILRAVAGSSPSYSTIATLTTGGANNSTTANCSGSSCTWTDNSTNDSSNAPTFGTQYEYEIQSYAGGFTAGPDTQYETLSMDPSSGVDTTKPPDLNAVSTVPGPGTKAWLVGANCSMAITTNGTSWTQVSLSSSVCPTGTNLTGIDIVDNSDGWAVGSGGLILVCSANCSASNASWADLTTEPTTKTLNAVTAVSGGGPGNYVVFAVGASDTLVYCAANNCSQTGATFAAINPTNLSGDTLNGVSTVDGNEGWLVGTTSSGGGVIAQCSSTASCKSSGSGGWTITNSPSSPMNSVFGLGGPGGYVYAVGNSGEVYACTANCQNASPTFSTVSGTGAASTNLTDAYVAGNNKLWLVGAGGFIDVCTNNCNATSGGTWSAPSASTVQNLASVTAVSSGPGTYDVWAVGALGTIVYSSGGSYSGQSTGLSNGSYTLQTTDLNDLQTVSATPTPYVTGPLPSTLPSSSSCSSNDLEVGFSPSVAGVPIGFAHAIVDYKLSSASSVSSQLLISTNSGSSWTNAGSLGTPTTSYQSVNVDVTSDIGSFSTSAGNLQLCVQLSGSGSPTASIQQVHLDVDAAWATAPSFTSSSSTTFSVGSAGSFTVAASGPPGVTSITESGSLPSGVTFNTSTHVLAGTPGSGTGGTYPITFTAANTVGSTSQSFTLYVDQTPAITSASSATFTVGSPGSFQATASGYPSPTFSETGSLPGGVTFSSSGLLSGTPATGSGGSYPVTIKATNTLGSANQSFTLTVSTFAGPSFKAIGTPTTWNSGTGYGAQNVSYPSGTSSGDLLILVIEGNQEPGAPSNPSGWNTGDVGGGPTGGPHAGVYWKVAGSETSVSMTPYNGGSSAAWVIDYSAGTGTLAAATSATCAGPGAGHYQCGYQTGGTTLTPVAATTSANAAIEISIATVPSANALSLSSAGSFIFEGKSATSTTGDDVGVADDQVATSGTMQTSPTWSESTATNWAWVTMAFSG